jgi:hypothetical protein
MTKEYQVTVDHSQPENSVAETRVRRPPMIRVILAFLIGTLVFAALNGISTPYLGLVGILSVVAWSLLSAYLREPLRAVVALGVWTGVLSVATSMAVGVEPFRLDASITRLVGPWSYLTWPGVGALICGASALAVTRVRGTGGRTAVWLLVVLLGMGLAFGVSLFTSELH